MDDPNKILITAGGLSLFALGIYTAKTSTSLAGKYLEARLGKPSLVRDTSRFTILDTLKHPIQVVNLFILDKLLFPIKFFFKLFLKDY